METERLRELAGQIAARMKARDWAGAEETLAQYCAARPGDKKAWYLRALAASEAGARAAASAHLQKALQIDPAYEKALELKSRVADGGASPAQSTGTPGLPAAAGAQAGTQFEWGTDWDGSLVPGLRAELLGWTLSLMCGHLAHAGPKWATAMGPGATAESTALGLGLMQPTMRLMWNRVGQSRPPAACPAQKTLLQMDHALQRLALPFLPDGQWPKDGGELYTAVRGLLHPGPARARAAFILGVMLEDIPCLAEFGRQTMLQAVSGAPRIEMFSRGRVAEAQLAECKQEVSKRLDEARLRAEELGLPADFVQRLLDAERTWGASLEAGGEAPEGPPQVWDARRFGMEDSISEETNAIIASALSELRQTGTPPPYNGPLIDRATPWLKSCVRKKRWGIF